MMSLQSVNGSRWEILDNTITTVIAFIVSMIPIFTVIIKLNSTITKLNTTIEILTEQMKFSQKDRNKIHEQLNDHETRISILESKGGKIWTEKH